MSSPEAIDPDLLERLRGGDDRAKAEFCEIYLPRLLNDRRWVRTRLRDDQLIDDAVHKTLLDFAENPHGYDPQRMPILRYLQFSSRRDLLNLLERERRRSERRAPLEIVELRPIARNELQEPPDLPGAVSVDEVLQRLWEKLPDPRDRQAVTMRLDGVKSTAEYADLYGLGHLPPEQQRHRVKQIKDRLDKVMRRLGEQLRGGG